MLVSEEELRHAERVAHKKWAAIGGSVLMLLMGGFFLMTLLYADEIEDNHEVYQAAPADKLAKLLEAEGPPLVFAHRGDHLWDAENSLGAFDRAVERGYDGIELDVINTADGVPIVSHTFDVDGIYVPEASVADLQDAAGKEAMPTLDEVFERVGGDILLIVEIKGQKDTSYGAEAATCKLIKEHGIADSVILSSLTFHTIDGIDAAPECEGVTAMWEMIKEAGGVPDGYARPLLGLQYEQLEWRKTDAPESVKVFSVYTPNEIPELESVMENGALIVQTDKPGKASRIRGELFDW